MVADSLIMIASSTGGPQVLRKVLTGLPVLRSAVVLVQHMQKQANAMFAKSLNGLTGTTVKVAESGDLLQNGALYMAPSEVHLALDGGNVRLFVGEDVNFTCPSADMAMQSVRPGMFQHTAGIVLTGLGCDGADGIRHLKGIGGVTFAQEPSTCVIDRMPESAINTGCVDWVCTPAEIRQALIRMAA